MAVVAAMSLPAAPVLADAAGPPAPSQIQPVALTPCTKPGSDTNAWIDKMQRGVYSGVCGSAAWFDGLFGTPRYDQDSEETFGRASLVEKYDRRDNFDTRLRLRARLSLPNVEKRLKLTFGRGDEQSLVEGRPPQTETPQPQSFKSATDEAWLLGLGYSKQGGLENGFDFGAGVRLNTPVDPYVKATYRHNFIFTENTMLRFRETPFWRDSRGFGATTQVSLDHLATETVLLRWNNAATVAEDTEGTEWGTSTTAFHSLGRRRAIAYTALLQGETLADVRIQNYGFETRFRKNVFREWLYMELSASVTWPRETLEEEREINPGVGIGFEMYFGPVPELEMR
jgi:hypothetical protein